jgi:hypothetical protein
MLGAPESPTYLVGKGQAQEAEAVATKLWGPKGPAQLSKPAGGGPISSVLHDTCDLSKSYRGIRINSQLLQDVAMLADMCAPHFCSVAVQAEALSWA